MAIPRLIFTAYHNSFKVLVQNLEQLDVEQIQKIESFVSHRKGIFDFNTYSFSIQKRLGFSEFLLLLKSSGLIASTTEEALTIKTEPRIGFGQYKGMQYNELTDSYLLWLKSNYSGKDRDLIFKELKKRRL